MPAGCIDEQRAQAFVGATLAEPARLEIEDHVDECASCRRLLAAMIRLHSSPAHEGARSLVGAQIGRYQVRAAIGRGAMGEVFRGDDLELARPVALKRLHARVAEVAGGRAYLIREARAAAQLQHPNVVAVHEIVDVRGETFLVMEWIEGATLRAWLRERARGWREIVQVVAAAGRGLAAAHAGGLLHRDFKPENILVDREGRPRVADFGLARPIDAPMSTGLPVPVYALHATTGALTGTPAYLAPELTGMLLPSAGETGTPVVRGHDARTDQYAFAITLYEALHDSHPFAGSSPEAMWREMAGGRIRRGARRIPAWLDRAVRRGLAVDPARRWPDLATMLDALERGVRRTRRRVISTAAAAIVAGAIGVGLLAPLARPEAPCGDDLVDTVWHAEAQATLARRFTAAAPERSAATITAITAQIGQWSDAWRLLRRSACVAGPARAARSSCLDRQLGELRAQLAVWEQADASVVDHATAAVAALPSPAECVDARDTTSPGSASLLASTAKIDALQRSGRWEEALVHAPEVLAQAERTTSPGPRAAALLAVARIELDAHARTAARDHARAAARAASHAREDDLLVAALMLEALVLIDDHRAADALVVCDAVEAFAARGLPRSEGIELLRADALLQLGRTDEAIVHYRRGIARLELAAGRDPSRRVALASAVAALGTALGRLDRIAEGAAELRRALEIEEAALGPMHPTVGQTLHDLARLERASGELEDAERHFDRTRKIFAAVHGEASFEVVVADTALADLASRWGDLERAQRLAERALATLAGTRLDEPGLQSQLENQLGLVEQERERCSAAIPHYERALALSLRAAEPPDQQALGYVNLATCLSDVGRDAEARSAAEQALAAWTRAHVEPPERAMAWGILADIEARGGDRRRAVALAGKAMAALGDREDEPYAAMRAVLHEQLQRWSG
ncbi:serine/threonine-protein kinase [Nannocystis bainbridge]|uniref:Serine/threonine-protein kinase n=1 Tax=Nannocystis bainbridge TaxID=2995303 RepID=A0ABT5DPV1_9BACT|nr:serine/threonine-protein kinase [Nannocystis bainbridge]MDC0715628.1 serine/threonine-protein kinase [Nannocystis bainbridge]